MAGAQRPRWKAVFDAVDRRITPRLNEFTRSDDFATLAALGRRTQSVVASRLERASRRLVHLLNLPAGSDVNRLLRQIASVEREVRDLRKAVEDNLEAEEGGADGTRARSHRRSDTDQA